MSALPNSLAVPAQQATAHFGLSKWHFGRNFWTFFTAAFFFDAGFALFFFLFNLYLVDLHYSERAIGSINAAFTLGSLLGTLPGGELTRRWGIRPLLLGCFAAAPLLGASRALSLGLLAQTTLAFLMGVAMSGWGVCFLPAVSRLTNSVTRSSAFGLIFAASVGTSAVGGLLCSRLPYWMATVGWRLSAAHAKRVLLLASCAVASIALLPLLNLRFPGEDHDEESEASATTPERLSWRESWRLDAFLGAFLPCMALWSGVLAVASVFANIYLTREFRMPLSRLAILFSCAQLFQLAASLLMPVLVRFLSRRNATLLVQGLAALALGALGITHTMKIAIVLYLLLSVAQWMSSPILYDLLMQSTRDDRRSTVAAMTMFGNGLAGAATTAITGILLSHFGYRAVLPLLAAFAVGVALAFRRVLHHPSVDRLPLDSQALGQ